MKIIDAHLHFNKIESFKRTAQEISFVDYTAKGLKEQYDKAGVIAGVAMGLTEEELGGFPDYNSDNPMGIDLEESTPEFILYCLGINPMKLKGTEKNKQLYNIEKELYKSNVAGIKIYAGYYPVHVYDDLYQPIYDLAVKFKLPVTIHCGDTYSERGLLKYSHPLNVDELAVMRRDVNFIVAHVGDPWVMDTAEILRKNYNVFADVSGLIVGDKEQVSKYLNEPLFVDHIKRAFVYADMYDRFLFGTDWPLVQIEPYIEFIKRLIPEKHWEDVFYNNAVQVFGKLKDLV